MTYLFLSIQTCLDKGGDLLTLKSRSHAEEVADSLLKSLSGAQELVWVGLYKNIFYWDDGGGYNTIQTSLDNFNEP